MSNLLTRKWKSPDTRYLFCLKSEQAVINVKCFTKKCPAIKRRKKCLSKKATETIYYHHIKLCLFRCWLSERFAMKHIEDIEGQPTLIKTSKNFAMKNIPLRAKRVEEFIKNGHRKISPGELKRCHSVTLSLCHSVALSLCHIEEQ